MLTIPSHYAMLSLVVSWPLEVAVTTLRCHSYLTVIVELQQLNDGREAE